MIVAALLALAAAATADLGPEPDGQHMTAAEIKASNARFTRDHPYYIRCQRREEIGSLVKTIRSCRTNAAWERAWKIGNQEARDVMEKVQSKSWNTSG
ncbi:hypothetical protein ACOYW6_11305 [Parablastomonas sp. CN1-191]|uniref:hypothetical protein n=1 Tax=Parablastomonas sp. CN1-191 TaxID=3400908 RepID=UPI003BF8EB29